MCAPHTGTFGGQVGSRIGHLRQVVGRKRRVAVQRHRVDQIPADIDTPLPAPSVSAGRRRSAAPVAVPQPAKRQVQAIGRSRIQAEQDAGRRATLSVRVRCQAAAGPRSVPSRQAGHRAVRRPRTGGGAPTSPLGAFAPARLPAPTPSLPHATVRRSLRCPPVSPASLWQAAAQARRGRSGRGRLSEKSVRFRPGTPGSPTPTPPQRGQGGTAAHVSGPRCPGSLHLGVSPDALQYRCSRRRRDGC